jgi:hypothetical protein
MFLSPSSFAGEIASARLQRKEQKTQTETDGPACVRNDTRAEANRS